MRVRTKHLSANGFSLKLTIGLDEARQRLELDCQIDCRKVMHVKASVITYTPYVQEPYEGSWDNMPEFQRWVEGSSAVKVLYTLWKENRQLTDFETLVVKAILEN